MDTLDTFDTATTPVPVTENCYSWAIPDGWQQGRGAWGGLIVGALIRAVEASEPDAERVVRSITANLVAPAVVGEHVIETQVVRRGSAVATWSATLRNGEGTAIAIATVIAGASRSVRVAPDYASWSNLDMPIVPPSHEVPRLEFGPPLGPVFVQHIDARVVAGLPGEAGDAQSWGWIDYARPVRPTSASVLALVDAWWPASLVALEGMVPIATVSFAANLLVDPADLQAGQPLLHHCLVTSALEGYTSEHRRLWTADGRLAVDNLQSIVLIA